MSAEPETLRSTCWCSTSAGTRRPVCRRVWALGHSVFVQRQGLFVQFKKKKCLGVWPLGHSVFVQTGLVRTVKNVRWRCGHWATLCSYRDGACSYSKKRALGVWALGHTVFVQRQGLFVQFKNNNKKRAWGCRHLATACSYSKQHALKVWALCHSVFIQYRTCARGVGSWPQRVRTINNMC